MHYNVIGLMSGTSMDGLDIAFCTFFFKNKTWTFKILHAETVSYSTDWLKALNESRLLPEAELAVLDISYGKYIAEQVKSFILRYNLTKVDFVSSHGHTVHHRPLAGITKQIGSGEVMFQELNLPIVYDFRTQDVLYGGQGAPLVPIGDEMLFSEFEACLNLGGFANISFQVTGARKAFDICPANIVLNYLALQLGFKYDKNGELALSGEIDAKLLSQLNALDYYLENIPKSLGVEWVESNVYPLLHGKDSLVNILRTCVEHIAIQIVEVLDKYGLKSCLVTGGGAYNSFLISRIKALCEAEIIIPDTNIVDFKEALVFAFLAVLRVRDENNILKSVTGATHDHSSGIIVK